MAFLWLIPQEALVGLKEEKELEAHPDSGMWGAMEGEQRGGHQGRPRAADLSKVRV